MCLSVFPDSPHIVCTVGKGKHKRDGKQGLVFFPPYGLLMP